MSYFDNDMFSCCLNVNAPYIVLETIDIKEKYLTPSADLYDVMNKIDTDYAKELPNSIGSLFNDISVDDFVGYLRRRYPEIPIHENINITYKVGRFNSSNEEEIDNE